jgi:Voltage-dependent anion channel
MGTGIVSVALAADNHATLSRWLLAIGAFMWIGLGLALCARLARQPARVLTEARSPAALSGVAATAVLGSGALQLGWTLVGSLLLALAFVAWPALTRLVLGRLDRHADGQWFMLTVATESLAGLSAAIALREEVAWLLDVALALAAIGILLYPFVLVRFNPRHLASARGEHWVAGGSLAISALAFAQIALADRRLGTMHDAAGALAGVGFVLWAMAMLWLGALVIAELRWPRLHYHPHRWSTVFPLGMYAACSLAVAAAARAPLLGDFARAWIWISLAGWALAFAGMLRRRAGRIRCLSDGLSRAGGLDRSSHDARSGNDQKQR